MYQETHVYDKYTKLCGDNHKIKWTLCNTEDLKVPDFVFMETILHYDVLETLEDD